MCCLAHHEHPVCQTADGSPKPIGMLLPAKETQPSASAQPLIHGQTASPSASRLLLSPTSRTPGLGLTPGTGGSRIGTKPSQSASSHRNAGPGPLQAPKPTKHMQQGTPQLDQPEVPQQVHRSTCGPHFSQIHQQHDLRKAASQQHQQQQEGGGESTWTWDSPIQQHRAPISNCSGTLLVDSDPVRNQRSQEAPRDADVAGMDGISHSCEALQNELTIDKQISLQPAGADDLAAGQAIHSGPEHHWGLPEAEQFAQAKGPSRRMQHTLSMQTQPGDAGQGRTSSRRKHLPQGPMPARPKSAKLARTAQSRAAPVRPGSARPVSTNKSCSSRSPARQRTAPRLAASPADAQHAARLHTQHPGQACSGGNLQEGQLLQDDPARATRSQRAGVRNIDQVQTIPECSEAQPTRAHADDLPREQVYQVSSAVPAAPEQYGGDANHGGHQAGSSSTATLSRIPKPKLGAAIPTTALLLPQAGHQPSGPDPRQAEPAVSSTMWVATRPSRTTRVSKMAAEIDAHGFPHTVPGSAMERAHSSDHLQEPYVVDSSADACPGLEQEVYPNGQHSQQGQPSHGEHQHQDPEGSKRQMGEAWQGSPGSGMQDSSRSSGTWWPGSATSPGISSSDPPPACAFQNQSSEDIAAELVPELTLAPWQLTDLQPDPEQALDSPVQPQETACSGLGSEAAAQIPAPRPQEFPEGVFHQQGEPGALPALWPASPAQSLWPSPGKDMGILERSMKGGMPSAQTLKPVRQRQWWLNNPECAIIPEGIQPLPVQLQYYDGRIPWECNYSAGSSIAGSSAPGLPSTPREELSLHEVAGGMNGLPPPQHGTAGPDTLEPGSVRLGFAWSSELWSHLGSAWPLQQNRDDMAAVTFPACPDPVQLQVKGLEDAATAPLQVLCPQDLSASPDRAPQEQGCAGPQQAGDALTSTGASAFPDQLAPGGPSLAAQMSTRSANCGRSASQLTGRAAGLCDASAGCRPTCAYCGQPRCPNSEWQDCWKGSLHYVSSKDARAG